MPPVRHLPKTVRPRPFQSASGLKPPLQAPSLPNRSLDAPVRRPPPVLLPAFPPKRPNPGDPRPHPCPMRNSQSEILLALASARLSSALPWPLYTGLSIRSDGFSLSEHIGPPSYLCSAHRPAPCLLLPSRSSHPPRNFTPHESDSREAGGWGLSLSFMLFLT